MSYRLEPREPSGNLFRRCSGNVILLDMRTDRSCVLHARDVFIERISFRRVCVCVCVFPFSLVMHSAEMDARVYVTWLMANTMLNDLASAFLVVILFEKS